MIINDKDKGKANDDMLLISATPPFDPPYFTRQFTQQGTQITEIQPDGRIHVMMESGMLQNRHSSLRTKQAPRSGQKGGESIGARPSKFVPLAQGNDRAVMFLNVSYSEKDTVKRMGARWDSAMRKWYVPHGLDINLFTRWWPETLKHETKPFGQL